MFAIINRVTKTTDFITNVLEDITDIANANFGQISSTVKPDDNNQVLTATDIEIGNLIVSRIKDEYPDYNIIDEEAGSIDNGSNFTWVVDPIDGTSNFAGGIHAYGTMIGLLDGGKPVAGGIALPFFKEIYVAEKGEGAYCNGNQINVSKESKLLNSLISYGIDGYQKDSQLTFTETKMLAKIILGIRNLRASNSVYDIALVASGKYGAWLNQTTKIWDNVAPQIIIEEAGGIYTDFWGKPIDYSDPIKKAKDNFTCCAGSPILHGQLQAIIHSTD